MRISLAAVAVALLVAMALALHPGGPAVAAAGACPMSPGGGPIELTDATAETGADSALVGMRGHAVAWSDVNRDGWPDVFVGTFADRPDEEYQVRGAAGPSPDRLLLGGADGFTIDASFPSMFGRTSGAAFADLDGDADVDLVVARNYRQKARGDAPTIVLRNDGGRFVQATTLATDLGARSIGVFDYDGDGQLDLFLAEDRWSGGTSRLLHNDGNLSFSDRTAAAGLPATVHGLGVATQDLNGDTRPDLLVAGSIPPKGEAVVQGARVWVNAGQGSFAEADGSVFSWRTYGNEDDTAGVAVADVNRDRLPDVVIGQHYGSTLEQGRGVPVRIYLNRGADTANRPRFEDVTDASGSPAFTTKAPHVEVVDFDNDGWPDLLASASAEDGAAPAVLRSLGSAVGGVPRFAPPQGLGSRQYWPTGGVADYDRDGRPDLIAIEWEPSLPSAVLRNTSAAGHHVRVTIDDDLRGVGTVVEAYCEGRLGDPAGLIVAKEIQASTGFGAGVVSEALVGVGSVDAVDLRIVVPNGGGVVEQRSVPADSTVEVAPQEAACPPLSISLACVADLLGRGAL